jgi:hypothetical protein
MPELGNPVGMLLAAFRTPSGLTTGCAPITEANETRPERRKNMRGISLLILLWRKTT